MGVSSLWDLVRPVAAKTSLSTLSKEAVLSNRNSQRALIIGIDASLWIFHASTTAAVKGGENPFLGTIFHRIAALLRHPVLPVFVFDGPKKPLIKRGQRMGGRFGTSDRSSLQFKELLNECGLEWWNAPGEAEAELAIMNRQGKIDAVISDDSDTLLFGARTLLRNNSSGLSGAQASSVVNSQKSKYRAYEIYQISAILEDWRGKGGALKTEEDCRMAMVFVALLAGGDYAPEGLKGFGAKTAMALAHAGYASFLADYRRNPEVFEAKLEQLLVQIVQELETNSKSFLTNREVAKASKLRELDVRAIFPRDVLDAYLFPVTSSPDDHTQGWPGFESGGASKTRGMARNGGRGDMEGMARACERFFEWGTRDRIIKKFSGEDVGVFGTELLNEARSALLLGDPASRGRPSPPASVPRQVSRSGATHLLTNWMASSVSSVGLGPSLRLNPPSVLTAPPARALSSSPVLKSSQANLQIKGSRPDPVDGDITELRIVYNQSRFADRVRSTLKGDRVDPKYLTTSERARLGLTIVEPEDRDLVVATQSAAAIKDENRAWLPEYLVREAWPELAETWDKAEEARKIQDQAKLAKQAAKTQRAAEKRGLVANGEDVESFAGFFTQAGPAPTQAARRAAAAKSIEVLSQSEEEEVLEVPSDTRGQGPKSSARLAVLRASPARVASSPPSSSLLAASPATTSKKPSKVTRPAPSSSRSTSSPTRSSRATSHSSEAPSKSARALASTRTVETPKTSRRTRTTTSTSSSGKPFVTATRSSPRLRTSSGRPDPKAARAATPLPPTDPVDGEGAVKTRGSRAKSGSSSKSSRSTRKTVTGTGGTSAAPIDITDLCSASDDDIRPARVGSRSSKKASASSRARVSLGAQGTPPAALASSPATSVQRLLGLPSVGPTPSGVRSKGPDASPGQKRRGRPPKAVFITVTDSSELLWIDCTGRSKAEIFAAKGRAVTLSPAASPSAH